MHSGSRALRRAGTGGEFGGRFLCYGLAVDDGEDAHGHVGAAAQEVMRDVLSMLGHHDDEGRVGLFGKHEGAFLERKQFVRAGTGPLRVNAHGDAFFPYKARPFPQGAHGAHRVFAVKRQEGGVVDIVPGNRNFEIPFLRDVGKVRVRQGHKGHHGVKIRTMVGDEHKGLLREQFCPADMIMHAEQGEEPVKRQSHHPAAIGIIPAHWHLLREKEGREEQIQKVEDVESQKETGKEEEHIPERERGKSHIQKRRSDKGQSKKNINQHDPSPYFFG